MATDSTSQWRGMRAGSERRVLSHFQPRLLMTPRSGPRASFEAQFDPEAQGVPAGSGVLRRQVGEDDPGFFLLGVPDHQESAAAFGLGSAEGGAAANPGGIGTAQEALGGQPASTIGAESDVLPVAHTGMPAPRSGRGQALGAYLLPQFGTGYAPVAEHDDGHIPGNRWGQFLEQFHRGVHPGAFLGGLVDAPGHGDGAATVDDADDDGGDLVPFQRGIYGQGQAAGEPLGRGPSGAGARSRE